MVIKTYYMCIKRYKSNRINRFGSMESNWYKPRLGALSCTESWLVLDCPNAQMPECQNAEYQNAQGWNAECWKVECQNA